MIKRELDGAHLAEPVANRIAPAGCVVLKEGQKRFPFALGNRDRLGGAQKTSGALHGHRRRSNPD